MHKRLAGWWSGTRAVLARAFRRSYRHSMLWPLAVLALIALLLVSAVFHWPAVIVGDTTGLTRAEVLEAENNVRGTLLTGIAGALFLVTAYLSWRQIQVTREGHLTDRFAKAVEQLGARPETEDAPDPLDVRLGGIYSLERIWRDSPKDRGTVVSVLAAFVREHSQARSTDQPRCPTDLQATLTVLGRLNRRDDGDPLDLTAANLAGRANLSGANLAGAILTRADLSEAQLARANLTGANMTEARFEMANLRGANLTRADLTQANLEAAGLEQANLTEADLRAANLTAAGMAGSDLTRANLSLAKLFWATLTGANLTGTKLGLADMEEADLTDVRCDEHTVWPDSLPEGQRPDCSGNA